MALGFPSQPVNWNFSDIILANRAGEHLGRGMESMGQSFGAGLQAYMQGRKQKAAQLEFEKQAEQAIKAQRDLVDKSPELFGGADRAAKLKADLEDTSIPASARAKRMETELQAARWRDEVDRWKEEQDRRKRAAELEQQANEALGRAVTPQSVQGPLSPTEIQRREAWNATPASERYLQEASRRGIAPTPGAFNLLDAIDQRAAARATPQFAPGQSIPVDGASPFVWSGHQLIPNPAYTPPESPEAAAPRLSPDGKFYQPRPGQWAPVREERAPAPMDRNQRLQLDLDQAELERTLQEIADHEVKLASGSKSTGWGPFGTDRKDRIRELRARAGELQANIRSFDPNAARTAAASVPAASDAAARQAPAAKAPEQPPVDPALYPEGKRMRSPTGEVWVKRGMQWVRERE